MKETFAYPSSLREGKLENKVAADRFGTLDSTRIFLKKLIVAAGMVVAVVGAVAVTALCLSRCLSVSYECQVDFLYEFDRPFREMPGRGILNADESNRNARYESIMENFRREMAFCSGKDGLIRCRHDPTLQGESESRIRSVLSSVRLDVTGMPSTNFVYSCRLVLSNGDKRNLDSYARFCMDRVKEQLNEENELSIAKCTTKEFQTLKKSEKKIEELEKAIANGEASPSAKNELRNERRTVDEMKKRIEEVKEFVLSTGGRRIIYEATPKISWVLRRKARKSVVAVGDVAQSL